MSPISSGAVTNLCVMSRVLSAPQGLDRGERPCEKACKQGSSLLTTCLKEALRVILYISETT